MSGDGDTLLPGFGEILAEAEGFSERRQRARAAAHLPGAYEEALPFARDLVVRHDAAMRAADIEAAFALKAEARLLALKLNGFADGISAGPDAPCPVLERACAALTGTPPLWGQAGDFVIEASGMRVRIEMDGVFGLFGAHELFPSFAAHAADRDWPFISETGYRSFYGCMMEPRPGLTPGDFARTVIDAHVCRHLKGRLVMIEARYRKG